MSEFVRRPPEIIQTSAMDCGPAALASLLGAHGVPVSVDALRTVCATDVDGTSVDDLEEVAIELGLDAEQVVVPLGQVLAAPRLYLPAILLTLTPDGYVHFVVVWGVRRGRVDIVDPAFGRRRVRIADLYAETLRHTVVVPQAAWEEYALGEDARIALTARLRTGDAPPRLQAAYARGAVDGVGGLLAALETDRAPVVEHAGISDSGDALVRVHGAVLVRAPRRRPASDTAERSPVLSVPGPGSPARLLLGLLAGERARVAGALLFAVVAGLAAVGEILAAAPMLQDGATTTRVLTLGMVVGVALGALVASQSLSLSAGRRLERGLRDRLLARLPRLGDSYVRSRPPADLAERGHGITLVRQVVELGALVVQRVVEAVAAAVVMVALAPAVWPAAVIVVVVAIVVPGWLMRWLAEPDLRARTAQGAIGLQLTDTLGAADVLRLHHATPMLVLLRAPLLALWARAAGVVQARLAGGQLLILLCGLLSAGVGTSLAIGAGEPAGSAIVVAVLAFTATLAAQDAAYVARRAVPLRNAMARVLEPLSVTLPDPAPLEHNPDQPGGASLVLNGVTVKLGSRCVLDDVTLELARGEHVAVVGTSGAGKSSLIALLAGWLEPTTGVILVDGSRLQGTPLAELRRATAWSDAATRVIDGTSRDNVSYGAASGAPSPGERLRAAGLPAELFDAPAATQSRPDRQRLLLARALGRPDARLVLLDEALSDLAGDERRRLLARVRVTWKRSTLIHVTHDAAGALDFTRVLVIENGQIIEDGAPALLATDPTSHFRGLLDAQQRLAARLQARAQPAAPPDPTVAAPPAKASARWGALLRDRAIIQPVALALLASLAATILLALSGDRLDTGARTREAQQPGWIVATFALLTLTAILLAAGARALGHAAVSFGLALRRRALDGAISARAANQSVGRRVGTALDLELLEATALGAGATLTFAGIEAVIALALLVLVNQIAAAAVLLGALGCAAALTRPLHHRGRVAAAARATVTEHLVDRLLSLRTVTLQENPIAERAQRTRMLADVQRAHTRVDHLRVTLAAALPRAGVLAMLTPLAINPPTQPTAAAGALGAVLLAYGALEQLGNALAELAPALASAHAAKDLLTPAPAEEPALPPGTQLSPAARPAHILHQPLAANALLASPECPQTDATFETLKRRITALDLDRLVDRMPLGLGQPLGETGWRLSQGERARLTLIRALMAEPELLIAEDPLSTLDAHTAERVLDALDNEPIDIRLL